ncbi:MAG: type II secretion system protein GspN [Desulfopila sp.]|jgi:type II secretion system protein N|nr:type II secretion system protein GspN [Desulfopila sp.]
MAKSKKETIYWLAVVLYGVLLTGVLLYLRFPASEFRQLCCAMIEETVPGVNCSIGSIRYGFPGTLFFEDFQLRGDGAAEVVLFEDPRLAVKPVWPDFIGTFAVESSAFGGQHSVKLKSSSQADTLELTDLKIENLDLARLTYMERELDRKVSGILTAGGSVVFTKSGFELLSGSGDVRISRGAFALHRPILGLDTMDLDTGFLKFVLQDKRLEITDGTFSNNKLSAVFSGEVQLLEPWLAAEISVKGELSPLPPLYQENRQLQAIVTRMLKQRNTKMLPFTVGGTVGRPTFVFE